MFKLKTLFLIIISLAYCQGFCSESIKDRLDHISFEEKIFLKIFFKDLLYYDTFGHVLCFETKPACLIALAEKGPGSFRQKLPAKGWAIWKKYENLFPHPNFIFCEEIIEDGKYNVSLISIINKKSLLLCLIEHENIFKNILGDSFSQTKFLADLEETKQLRPLINYDEALLGILLGFGKEASLEFKEKKLNGELDLGQFQAVLPDWPKKCPIIPVGFLADPDSDEVKHLLDLYSSELKTLRGLYHKKNLLHFALQRLCELE